MNKLKVSEWCCAIRFNNTDNESLLNDCKTPFTVLKDSYRYWTADPFLFEKDGITYLFFEMFDRLKRKGALGYREISQGHIGKLNIAYECEYHMSYPFIYEEQGNVYIIPECEKSGELFRLKALEFPNKWEKETVIAKIPLVDTTLIKCNDTRYYFTERIVNQGKFDRLDLFYEQSGKLVEFKNNPVKIDDCSARSAGKIFKDNDTYIRPSQNCGDDYGVNLNFNKIIVLNQNEYLEKTIKKIYISDILTSSKKKFCGVHTYNKLNNIEVIDLKIRNFNVLNFVGGILKRMNRR